MKAYRVTPHLQDNVDLIFAKNKQQARLLTEENLGLCNSFGPRKYELWPEFTGLSNRDNFVIKRESKFDGMEHENRNNLIYKLIKIAGWFYGDYQITYKNIDQKDIRDYLSDIILKRNSIFFYDRNLRQ